jgi:DNA polymerase-3 subunit delta
MAKIYADKLADTLKRQAASLFIVSGDDPLLVQESCDLVRANLKERGYIERELFHVEGSFDWSSLLYSTNSMSLFADKKLLEVRMPSGKPGDQGSKALQEILEQLGDETAMLLVLPRVDQQAQRTKWFKALEAKGLLVQVWPIDAKDLPRWLNGRFRQAGLRVTSEAVQVMAQRIEGNLLAAVQEIERLKLTAPDGQVDVEDVIEGVADSARFDVFKLIDAALMGNVTRCVRMATGLRSEGVEIMFVINMLAREIRSLETMKSAVEDGQRINDVWKKNSVWKNRIDLVSRCLERHSAQSLRELEESVGITERMVKGIVVGDPWREVQNIVLSLAGRQVVPSVRSLNSL